MLGWDWNERVLLCKWIMKFEVFLTWPTVHSVFFHSLSSEDMEKGEKKYVEVWFYRITLKRIQNEQKTFFLKLMIV